MQKIVNSFSDMSGKTIKDVKQDADNVVILSFTDGSQCAISADRIATILINNDFLE